MKITCERCRAQYDIDDAKIPPSGFRMTCPACTNEMTVKPGTASAAEAPAAGPREISLSSMDDDAIDLPQPVKSAGAAPASLPAAPSVAALAESALADLDFSSINVPAATTSAPPPIALADEPDLPAPVARGAAPQMLRPPGASVPPPRAPHQPDQGIVDLPAPRTRSETPKPVVDTGPDLPTPKVAKPPGPPAVKPSAPRTMDAPALVDADAVGVIDLPKPSIPNLPKPKAPPPAPGRAASAPSVSAGPPVTDDADIAIPLELDAPDVDDNALLTLDSGADLPQPRADGSVDLPAPRADGSVDLPTPRADASVDGLAPKREEAAVVSPSLAASLPGSSGKVPVAAPAATPDPASKKKTLLFVGGGVGLLAVAGGVAVALNLFGGGAASHRELEVKLVAARRALSDEMPVALRRAVADLKPYTSGDHPNDDALTVEAQAHFELARLGVAGELAFGKALLDRTGSAAVSADRKRAEGLRALAAGDTANARKALKDILANTPGDAAALSYLGWVELLARDPATAEATFGRALTAEASRAQAAYGLGFAKERVGNDVAAREAYVKVITTLPDHARAAFGLLRIDARSGDAAAATKLETAVVERASTLTPREQAEGFVALGQVALAGGRRDEAEERFKSALALDADPATSLIADDARLGLARTRIEGGRGAEAIDDLRKLMATDLRGVLVRLLLAEALLDKGATAEAETIITAAERLQPKSARIAFLRGRALLARPSVEREAREQAVERFKEATDADPKMLSAWAALARTLNDLGRTPEAVEALGKAAAGLSSDPRGAATLGAAYLAIGRPADAEARFRAVIASTETASASFDMLPIWLGLGDALEAQNKLDDAIATYADAQKRAPKSAAVLERLGRLAVRRGKLDDARGYFDSALKLGSPTAPLQLAAGELALKTNRLSEARGLIEPVIKGDDRSALANLLLARVEVAGGHPEEAIGLARRSATLQDLPEAHLLLGQLLEGMNKLEGAAAEYMLARRAPVIEQASLGRARILVRMGATRDALAEIGPLTARGELRTEALLLQGDCYSDLQQLDKARASYEAAAKLTPSSGDAAFKFGRALLDAGKLKPGLDAIERAIKLAAPKTAWLADAYLLVGDARRQNKENDAAIRAYTKYLELSPANAPMRKEATRQISLLGGAPPQAP